MRGTYGTPIIGVDIGDPLGVHQQHLDSYLPIAAVFAVGVVIAHVTHVGHGKKHQWRRR